MRRDGADLLIAVRLTPRADRDAVEGMKTAADGASALTLRVRAVPEGGKANRAAIALLSTFAGVPKSAIFLEKGAGARAKIFRFKGVDETFEAELRQKLLEHVPEKLQTFRIGTCDQTKDRARSRKVADFSDRNVRSNKGMGEGADSTQTQRTLGARRVG